MAWNMPPLIVSNGVLNEPRSSAGTNMPWNNTVTTIIIMPISANVLALANYHAQTNRQSHFLTASNIAVS